MSDMSYDRPGFSFDDLEEFEDEDAHFRVRDDSGGRGPLILALAGGVLVVFGAVVWNTYSQGVRTGDGDLPTVLADGGDFKRPGPGAQVEPDQPQRVYRNIETIPEDVIVKAAVRRPGETGGTQDVRLAGAPPMDLRPGTEVDDTPRPQAAPEPEAEPVIEPAPVEVARLDTPELRTDRRESGDAADVSMPSRPIAPSTRFNFAANGNYLVQVAALRSENGAREAWNQIIVQYPDVFEGATRYIQRADLGAKGVFFRLRAGRFQDRAEAVSFCDAIKAGGDSCIVVER